MSPCYSGCDICFLGPALEEPVTVTSEGSQQMGKMEMPLLWSRGALTLTRALSLPWALTLVLSQLPQGAERAGISSSRFRDGEVNCLKSPQSEGAPEQGWASPLPAQCISHHTAQSSVIKGHGHS